ncbi:MAG: hypothetical protein ACFE7A_05935 [Promethearchaeota archaeon]
MTLGALYIIASGLKNNTLKGIVVVGVVASMYSLSYFYYLLPGGDSHTMRSLTEYYTATGDLNHSEPYRSYFQWPSLFILSNIATNLLGLQLKYFEFVLYAAMGFLYASSLYAYFSRIDREGSYIAVIAFFTIVAYQFNYQFAPFSLCIGLLFLLFAIESHGNTSRSTMLSTILIFASMTFIHPFVPVFFVLYTIVKYILSKEKRYITLFSLTLITYLAVLIFYTAYLPNTLRYLTRFATEEYPRFAERLTVAHVDPLDAIAQMLSSTVLIVTAVLSGLGFIILLLRKKRALRHTDHAILVSAIIYIVAGYFVDILGLRALSLAAIPVSLGATYFLKTKLTKYYKCLFLVLIVLFTFVILHGSYSWKWFQTRDDYRSANFFIEFYDLSRDDRILSYGSVSFYIRSLVGRVAVFETASRSPPLDPENYDCIIYTAGLERTLLAWNYSVESKSFKTQKNFNIVFTSGFSFIAISTNNSVGQ